MTVPMRLGSDDLVMPLLLVKALLAVLAVILFLYYRFYWERAKRHLAVHFFFTKWRTVKYAFILGFAAAGFAIGFSLELAGQQLGLGATEARFISSIFEVGSLFCMLYVFFTLSLEDVPHFQHIADSVRARKRHGNGANDAQAPSDMAAAPVAAQALSEPAVKRAKAKGAKKGARAAKGKRKKAKASRRKRR